MGSFSVFLKRELKDSLIPKDGKDPLLLEPLKKLYCTKNGKERPRYEVIGVVGQATGKLQKHHIRTFTFYKYGEDFEELGKSFASHILETGLSWVEARALEPVLGA